MDIKIRKSKIATSIEFADNETAKKFMDFFKERCIIMRYKNFSINRKTPPTVIISKENDALEVFNTLQASSIEIQEYENKIFSALRGGKL